MMPDSTAKTQKPKAKNNPLGLKGSEKGGRRYQKQGLMGADRGRLESSVTSEKRLVRSKAAK